VLERYQRPSGTQDILPGESERFERLRRLFLEVATRYGYRQIETPVFEQTAVFVEGVGTTTDIVQHERYTFEDAGGISLTLRPEGTAAIARAYTEHGMAAWPQPVRLCYWMPMFRRERPQAGRYRQHWQYGAELWGSAEPAADAEVIRLAVRLLTLAGETPVVRVNSIGCDTCRPAYREALVAYYRARREVLCEDCQARLEKNPLRLLDCKRDRALAEAAPDFADYWCDGCRAHLARLFELLEPGGVPVTRDPRLVRGLDYYTRTVFEVDDKQLGAQSTILGGGRYDGLNARFEGPPVPAVGFAGGVERLLLALGERFAARPRPGVYVARVGSEREAAAVAEMLRDAGIPVETDVMGRSLKAQMKDAARRATWVVLAGGREAESGAVTVRDLINARESLVPLTALVEWLQRALNGA
jgi:histidyl-tRNA synthetase